MKKTWCRSAPGALALIAALALSGCAQAAPSTGTGNTGTSDSSSTDCGGVSVVIDFGVLDTDTVRRCVDADGGLAASAVLQTADITTEGTVEYGDQIVCRVNDRPGAAETVDVEGEASFTETCAAMPAAYAYWALWVKSAPGAEWAYAQEGLGSLQTEPGESLGLVYTTGTETPTPGS